MGESGSLADGGRQLFGVRRVLFRQIGLPVTPQAPGYKPSESGVFIIVGNPIKKHKRRVRWKPVAEVGSEVPPLGIGQGDSLRWTLSERPLAAT